MGESSSSIYVRKSSGLIRTISGRSALIANLIGMGILVNIFWVYYASALYPNADLPSTVFIGMALNLLVAYAYWMLATAMPRTGGDYVYVSRIFHPAVGFMENLMFVVLMVTWAGLFPQLIASQGMQMMFANLYLVTGNSYYLSVAQWLTTQFAQFIIGFVIVTLVILLNFLPVKWIFRIVTALFVIQAIIYVWFVAQLAMIPHDTFVSDFNQKFGANAYQQVLNLAKNNYQVDWTITAEGTFIGIVYTMLSYIGYANSAYFAGEVRGDPRSSQGLAIFGSPIIFSVIIYILYSVIYNTFGHDFLVASSVLSLNGDQGWIMPAAPSPAHLVAVISNDPFFVSVVPFGLVLTFFGFALIYFFVPTRNIFAYAFDRIIPTKVAEVNRYGIPWVAVLIYGVIAYVSLYLTVYTQVFSYLSYANFGWWLSVAIVMFAAASFPFLKKDIFESSPRIVKRKLGPIPVITLVGIIGGILSLWVSYSTILPSFTGAPINAVYILSILLVYVIALLIFIISYFIQ
ncbi:MAG TPA: amino acid permease, partial [Geobacterales bacterium]|nr:amino acid permease [Geobacterales bacterium]